MPATLVSLRIRNFALVEEMEWNPGRGMNAITGETGAGKSVLIGALKLLLGERAEKGVIRAGAEQSVVEAVFELPQGEDAAVREIAAILEEGGAEACEEGQLILKRVVTEAGSRQFVNGSACTLGLLRKLGDLLADLHGPHDHQSLFSREEQTRLLDAYSGAQALAEEFRRERARWIGLKREWEELNEDVQAVNREVELLRHQVEEIGRAELKPGEEKELEVRHRAAVNSKRILELGLGAVQLLRDGEPSLVEICGELSRTFREMVRLDARAAGVEGKLMELSEQVKDLAREVELYLREVQVDEEELMALEARMDLLGSLRRKYGNTVEEILEFGRRAQQRLRMLENREVRGQELEAEISQAWERVRELGLELGHRRREGARRLVEAVQKELVELGFRQAGFEVRLEEVGEAGGNGFELAEFLFAPNPGEPMKPLRQIASSGEISRVMLALKCVLAAEDRVGVMVFDEIDANVGGQTAVKVGRKMNELGRSRQVLCITHLPQVAAAAQTHFLVEKRVEGGRTTSHLRLLEGESREMELARMLGGGGPSAIEHARSLLGEVRSGEEKPKNATGK